MTTAKYDSVFYSSKEGEECAQAQKGPVCSTMVVDRCSKAMILQINPCISNQFSKFLHLANYIPARARTEYCGGCY